MLAAARRILGLEYSRLIDGVVPRCHSFDHLAPSLMTPCRGFPFRLGPTLLLRLLDRSRAVDIDTRLLALLLLCLPLSRVSERRGNYELDRGLTNAPRYHVGIQLVVSSTRNGIVLEPNGNG